MNNNEEELQPLETPTGELTLEECQHEIERIGKMFDKIQVDLGRTFYDQPMVTSAQCNALGKLLVEKGIISEEEINLRYFRLLAERFRQHEENDLAEARKQYVKRLIAGAQ